MSKFTAFLLFTLAALSNLSALAQEKNISGVILSERDGSPLSGASIQVRGTTRGSQTDVNGTFIIQAKKGDVLIIGHVGFGKKEIIIGNSANLTVRLTESDNTLEEVVVALDLKRKPRELGYSTQRVNGTEIQETQRENFLNSLQGRVAGLTINPTGGTAGASSAIVLRGFNSLSLSNEPLFVVDGIIMDNQTVNETSNGGQGVGLASDRPNRNNDYTNRMADINPNDIESVTILKGPEATALYGSQASSGAILITTKKAKSNKLAVQYDNSFRLQAITRFPDDVIDNYSNGENGASTGIFRYFGPAYEPGTKLYDNKDYFSKQVLLKRIIWALILVSKNRFSGFRVLILINRVLFPTTITRN